MQLIFSGLVIAFSFFLFTVPNLAAAPLPGLPTAVKPSLLAKKPTGSKVLVGCPKLVAGELHIVRVETRNLSSGPAYRFILEGTLENNGLKGQASFGFNVSQQEPGQAPRRIAFKLLNRSVRAGQRIQIVHDLHIPIRSEPVPGVTGGLPSFSLAVLNLFNDHSSCYDPKETKIVLSAAAVRNALPVQLRGGVSQSVSALRPQPKASNIETPVVSAPKSFANGKSVPSGWHPSAAATHAKQVGENAARSKQIRQMQQARDLGSTEDQARRGPTGRQDCSHSPNPAACLQANLHSPNSPNQSGTDRRSLQACLMGSHPESCFNSGSQSSSGRVSRGPGDPRDRIKDPRGVSSVKVGSYDSGPVKDWSPWVTTHRHGDTIRSRDGKDGQGNNVREVIIIDTINNESTHSVSVSSRDRSHTEIYSEIRDANDRVVNQSHDVNNIYRPPQDSHNHVVPGILYPDGWEEGSQSAPEGSNGPANDNCDWNPALGKCMKAKSDPQGMTSQPGPDGENPGSQPGSATPHIGSDAVTNGGGGDWNTSGRRGFGLGTRNKPLDMKDPGSPPGAGTPK